MPLRSYRPTSPGMRETTRSTFEEITTDEPHKPLTERLLRRAGRNNQGKLTVRHQGSGHKRLYRVIDWKRDKSACPRGSRPSSTTRTARRASACSTTPMASKRYMLAAARPGRRRRASPRARTWRPRTGNALPLSRIPLGTQIHNIELVAGRGGQIVRSAGSSAQLLAKEGDYAHDAAAVGRGAPRARSSAWPPSAR